MYSRRNKNNGRAKSSPAILSLVGAAAILLLWLYYAFDHEFEQDPGHAGGPDAPKAAHLSTPVRNPIEEALTPPANRAVRDGVAAAILLDTSGSMNEQAPGAGGAKNTKLAVATDCLTRMVAQAEVFAREHPEKPFVLGVYEFSSRSSGECRTVVPFAPPDAKGTQQAVSRLRAEGNTPIGDAMIRAKQDLDRTGMSRQHILVITDGQNNRGHALPDVVSALMRLPEDSRPAVYLVAFDVAEGIFSPVRDAGGLVLSANDQLELQRTVDYVLTGKILAEQPTPG